MLDDQRMMAITVYIDHNVWDYMFERGIDLAAALPKGESHLCPTREANFEIPPTPPEKNAFIKATMAKCDLKTDAFFGFNAPSLPQNEQRVGGFDVDRFASPEAIAFTASQSKKLQSARSAQQSCIQTKRYLASWRRRPGCYAPPPGSDVSV